MKQALVNQLVEAPEVPIPPMPTWIPGNNDPTVVPTEQIDLAPPKSPDGVLYAWYNPVDWAKGTWSGAKQVGGWVWDSGKWVFKKGLDPCTYFLGITLPAQHVPGLKKIVKENGCSPAGQQIGSALAGAYATAQGGPLAGFAAQVGASVFYGCLCKKWQTELDLPPEKQADPEQASALSTPVIVGIVGLLAAAAYNFAATRGKPRAPVVVSAPSVAPVKAESKSAKPKQPVQRTPRAAPA